MITPYWIDPTDDKAPFPDVELALREPDGLLAIGGGLSPKRLINAYTHGIFPWYSAGQPILWWSPDPRLVLYPAELRISRSLRKTLRRQSFDVTFDQAFAKVINACAEPRPSQDGTWITPEMNKAYCQLHEMGLAHSVEAWHQGELLGGLYGVAIGQVFFGESMFSRRTDASKVAFAHLVRHLENWNYRLIDCQVKSTHLVSLGAREIPRRQFTQLLTQLTRAGGQPAPWRSGPVQF